MAVGLMFPVSQTKRDTESNTKATWLKDISYRDKMYTRQNLPSWPFLIVQPVLQTCPQSCIVTTLLCAGASSHRLKCVPGELCLQPPSPPSGGHRGTFLSLTESHTLCLSLLRKMSSGFIYLENFLPFPGNKKQYTSYNLHVLLLSRWWTLAGF